MKPWLLGGLALTQLTQLACGALTREEAATALEEIKISSQAQALTSNSIEIGTKFTIGDAAENAAAELRTFVQSQLPCAEVTLQRNDATQKETTLTIEYGKNPGNCQYRGHKFSGRHTISVARTDRDLVEVDHIWEELSNGEVLVNGTASVDWDFSEKTRHVVHNSEWTRLKDGRSGEGSGDRTQQALAGGIATGFSVDGTRNWKGEKGSWDLDIDQVEMRWIDPVPQAGTYTLDTPFDKQLSVAFERVNATKINVTVAGPKRSFDFDVLTLPASDDEATQ